jgi:NuA3 HAT complex component NTO1
MSASEDDDEVCAVCGDGSSTDANMIVFCEGRGCSVAVHQQCYGIVEVPEGDIPWYCDACVPDGRCKAAAKNSAKVNAPQKLACVLCKDRGGALKQAGTGKWAHALCVLAFPEAHFKEKKRMRSVKGVGAVLASQQKGARCTHCRRKGGALLFCASEGCGCAFHPLCQLAEGLPMGTAAGRNDSEVECHAWCRAHESGGCTTRMAAARTARAAPRGARRSTTAVWPRRMWTT